MWNIYTIDTLYVLYIYIAQRSLLWLGSSPPLLFPSNLHNPMLLILPSCKCCGLCVADGDHGNLAVHPSSCAFTAAFLPWPAQSFAQYKYKHACHKMLLKEEVYQIL